MFFKTLHSRLTLLIVIVAVPGVGGLIYESVKERQYAIDLANQKALNTMELTMDFQAFLIEETQVFLRNLVSFDEVQSPDSPQCSQFLQNVLKVNSRYVNLGVPLASGELLCNATSLRYPVNVSDRDYIRDAMDSRGFSIGEYQVDRVTGIASVNFAYPVIHPDDNKIVGVAVAVISLNWWSDFLSKSNLPEGSHAYITDREQKIIASYPADLSILGVRLSRIESDIKLSQTTSENPSPKILTSFQNGRVFVSRPLIDGNNSIQISVGIPFDEQLKAINQRFINAALFLGVLILSLTFIARWGIRRTLLSPLKRLLKSAENLEQGKAVEQIEQHGAKELVALQRRFNSMARTRIKAEQKLIESQSSLQESERELSGHIENTPLGCITWDRNMICTKWNRSATRIFGYSAEEAIGKSASELILLPEMTTMLSSVFRQIVSDRSGHRRSNKNKTKSGQIITCEWYSTPIVNQQDDVVGVTSLVQDVTTNKELEERLKLVGTVFSHAREGIFITDPNARIIEVNDTFISITGYSRDEVIGKNPSLLKSNLQSESFYKALWASLDEKGYWTGEIWNKRKNDEIYAQLLTISVVKDEQDNIKNYIAIFSDISDAKEQQNKLEKMAHYDVLTNLPNRTLLAQRLEHSLTQGRLEQKYVAVALLDLDGFKEVNDEYGHDVGDRLLLALSNKLQGALRECDTLSRFGGDEFVAVLANLTEAEEANALLNGLLKAASEPVTIDTYTIQLSASIGVALYPKDHTDADQLIRYADQAMYLAKQKGKNCYHLFDIDTEDAIKARHEKLARIDEALRNREFILFYQPKVNMRTGEIIGVEALIRWQHPEKGLLSPVHFLPIVENHQLSIDIDEWVIDESIAQMSLWQQAGIHLSVSVNIGAKQIQQPYFVADLKKRLARRPDVKPGSLELEMLETSKLDDLKHVADIMSECVKLGVSFAIDDFGTGYSSLTYLRRLPASMIKIDQTFVRDMLEDADDKAIVNGVIALAVSFSRQVIAEGVESLEHGKVLMEMGCELAQGYGIARPMPAEKIPQWANEWTTSAKWTQNFN
ncbi:EAL domain-containing protein [Alteromonas sp. 14N.309.X.WAT.G.H12]|uniref:EAL domain-containing protein n=1 Tax=Alteromonas sp. 14N.309.X.WAT.G.H12 TaxID=3120824 RepID=UPI002FD6725B